MVLHERITRFVAEMKGKFSTFGPAACKPTQGPSINYVVSKSAIFDPLTLSSFLLSKVYVVNRLLGYLPPPFRRNIVYGRPLSCLTAEVATSNLAMPFHFMLCRKIKFLQFWNSRMNGKGKKKEIQASAQVALIVSHAIRIARNLFSVI